MLGRWWQRQAMTAALLVTLTVLRLQVGDDDWRSVTWREAAAIYLLAYVGAFWLGIAVRWPGRRRWLLESAGE